MPIMRSMTVSPDQIRVSQRERLRAVETLRRGARDGRLSDLTLSDRLDMVLDARSRGDLHAALGDLRADPLWVRAASAVRRWRGRVLARRRRVPLDVRLPPAPGCYIIGRDDDCDLRLTDDSVSRSHAMLTSVGDHWMVADLGSTNGTRLNGWRVQVQSPVRPGDVLDLGLQRLRIVA